MAKWTMLYCRSNPDALANLTRDMLIRLPERGKVLLLTDQIAALAQINQVDARLKVDIEAIIHHVALGQTLPPVRLTNRKVLGIKPAHKRQMLLKAVRNIVTYPEQKLVKRSRMSRDVQFDVAGGIQSCVVRQLLAAH